MKFLMPLLIAAIGLTKTAIAQVIVPPALPSQVAGSLTSPNPVTTVNCDMLEYQTADGSVGFLKAIARDDKNLASANDVLLFLSDGVSTINISLAALGFTMFITVM